MSANQQTWFGQPRGLKILFLTGLWEIFSSYGMRALLGGFSVILAVISAIAAAMLLALDPSIWRIEAARAAEIIALNATQPEPEPA